MALSKESMLEEMRLKGGAIMATLMEEDVKIKPDHLHIPEDGMKFLADFIRKAHHWLVAVYDAEYAEVRRIKKMQPDEMWARYKKWGGFEEHREVVLLNNALVTLRAKLVSRERPDFFKKSKRENKKNYTQAAQAAASKAKAPAESGTA